MLLDGIILFIFGLAFGSFFNVLTMRYDGERSLFNLLALSGRSHCPHCHTTLTWYELIPVVSFIIQGGKCRNCKKRISIQYPIVECLTGLIFAFVPLHVASLGASLFWSSAVLTIIAGCWIVALSLLLIMSVIDLRLGIIPDELNIVLFVVGAILILIESHLVVPPISFFGAPGMMFGFATPIWLNRIIGAVAGLIIFGGLWLLTRGRGMGFGDVKLAIPLGLLFGWPDMLGIAMAAFIIGAIVGIIAIMGRRKTMQSAIPFGPFLAVASVLIFFAGTAIATGYFGMMGL